MQLQHGIQSKPVDVLKYYVKELVVLRRVEELGEEYWSDIFLFKRGEQELKLFYRAGDAVVVVSALN